MRVGNGRRTAIRRMGGHVMNTFTAHSVKEAIKEMEKFFAANPNPMANPAPPEAGTRNDYYDHNQSYRTGYGPGERYPSTYNN